MVRRASARRPCRWPTCARACSILPASAASTRWRSEARPTRNGVAVTYRLVAMRRVMQVDFRGNAGIADAPAPPGAGHPGAWRADARPASRGRARPARALRVAGLLQRRHHELRDGPARSRPVRARLHHPVRSAVAGGRARRERDRHRGARGPRAAATWSPASRGMRTALDRRTAALPLQRSAARATTRQTSAWRLDRRDAEGLVDVTVEAHRGPLRGIVFDAGERARATPCGNWCRSSAKARWTRISSRIPSGESSAGCTAGATRGRSVDYERDVQPDRLRITFRVRRGPLLEVGSRRGRWCPIASREADVQALVRLRPGNPFSEEACWRPVRRAITELYRVRGFDERVACDTSQCRVAPSVPPRWAAGQSCRASPSPKASRRRSRRVALNGVSPVHERSVRALLTAPARRSVLPAAAARRPQRGGGLLPEPRIPRRPRGRVPRPADTPGASTSTYEITEGPQYRIGHVLIAGNTRTSDATILRNELNIQAGPPGASICWRGASGGSPPSACFAACAVDELPHPGRHDV